MRSGSTERRSARRGRGLARADRWLDAASDDELLGLGRGGDDAALAELYLRHRDAAVRYARRLLGRSFGSHVAEDVVAEAVHKTLGAISRGHGPVTGFRPYLRTAIKRVIITVSAHPSVRRRDNSGEIPDETVAGPDEHLTSRVAMDAFSRLPLRLQQALWAAQVDDATIDQAASRLDMSPDAFSSLLTRARQALRIEYVRAHLPDGPEATCDDARELIARVAVTELSGPQRRRLDFHLADCHGCRSAQRMIDVETETWPRWIQRQSAPGRQTGAHPA